MLWVEKTDSCWLWTGNKDHKGYGNFHLNSRDEKAHRVSYELFVGEIPAGLYIDHVKTRGCENRHCVNPAHLEPVTNAENVRRGSLAAVTRERFAAIKECKRGHPWPESLFLNKNGNRQCRPCQTFVQAENRRRQRNG